MNIQFALDTKIINAFYKEIESAKINDLDITFNTLVSDSLERSTKQKLVQIAIDDAKQNAQNIADGLKINISGIKQVTKSGGNNYKEKSSKYEIVKFMPPKIVADTKISYDTSFDKFQVEEIDLEESITIVFEISKKQVE